MIKENQKYLNRLQIVVDIGLIAVSMVIAYWARFELLGGMVSLNQNELLRVAGWTIFVYVVSYYSSSETSSVSSITTSSSSYAC